MKKRELAVALAVTMVCLAGCAGPKAETTSTNAAENSTSEEAQETSAESENSGGEGLTLSFWNLWDGSDSEYAQAMVDQFCEENNCTIEVTVMSSNDFYTKMATAGITGEGPDVAAFHVSSYIDDYKEAGIIESLTAACEKYGVEINFEDYVSDVADNAKIDGEYYALPIDTISRVIVYNKSLLEGTSALNEDGTLNLEESYDGFVAMCEAIKNEVPDAIAPVAFSPLNAQHVLNFLSFYDQAADTPFFDNGEVTFDDTVAAQVLADFSNVYMNYCPAGISGNEDVDLFLNGQIPVIVTGTFNIGTMVDTMGDTIGMTYFPQWYNDHSVTVNSHGLALCTDSERSDAETELAVKFIQWWGDHEYEWAESGALPSNITTYESEEFLSLPGRRDLVEAATYSRGLPKLPTGQIHSTTEINTPIGAAVNGQETPEDAVAEVRAYCEKLFAEAAQ